MWVWVCGKGTHQKQQHQAVPFNKSLGKNPPQHLGSALQRNSDSEVNLGVDPGFWSGGPNRVLTQRGALSPKFAQNRGFSLNIARKLYDFKKILGARGAGTPGPPWIRYCNLQSIFSRCSFLHTGMGSVGQIRASSPASAHPALNRVVISCWNEIAISASADILCLVFGRS